MTGVDCPFCERITAGEYDYSDAWCVAFQPLNPVASGHFLVVPRTHISNVFANPEKAGQALKFAGYLANQMDLGAANFITSAGSAATQTVFHLHIHVVPRREGDGLALPWTSQKSADIPQAEPGTINATGPGAEAERHALLEAWAAWVREGWVREWPQERAEVAYRALVAGWKAAAPHITAAVRAEDAPRHNDAIYRQAAAAVYAERRHIGQLAEEQKTILHRPGLGTSPGHACTVEVIGMGKLRDLLDPAMPVGADAEPGVVHSVGEEDYQPLCDADTKQDAPLLISHNPTRVTCTVCRDLLDGPSI